MKVEFVWPSDFDRAESDELNRVCEFAEELYAEVEQLRDQVNAKNSEISTLRRERDQMEARLGHCQRFLASGILYTYDELLRHDADVIDRAINECAHKTLEGEVIYVECIREYANQLRQQAKCE
jgi:uncharacterized coiled-coil DUF342 family protein